MTEGSPRGVVLHADDNWGVRRSTALHLEDNGFEVLSAASGQEVFSLIPSFAEKQRIAAILDGRLPDMKGEDVAQELRSHFPDLPIISLAGQEDETFGHWNILKSPKAIAKVVMILEVVTGMPNVLERLLDDEVRKNVDRMTFPSSVTIFRR